MLEGIEGLDRFLVVLDFGHVWTELSIYARRCARGYGHRTLHMGRWGMFGGMVRSEEWTIPREASTTPAIEILNLRIYFRAHPAGLTEISFDRNGRAVAPNSVQHLAAAREAR